MHNNIVKIWAAVSLIMPAALLLACLCLADGLKINSPAPYFEVVSGSGEELTLDSIKGKVAVIFYETKDKGEINRKLKDELNKFYEAQPDSEKKVILRIAVVNCAGVFLAGAWKKGLKERSKTEGITIYGDWTGKMASSYAVKDNEANLIIIDKTGLIRYYSIGKIEDKDINPIKDLLTLLLK